jgi:hypothetical protein
MSKTCPHYFVSTPSRRRLLLTERATSNFVPPLVPATTIFPSLWSTIDVMNVAGVAAEAGGDATAVSECGIQFPVADVTGQRESLGERVVISGLPRRDDVPIRLERNREGVCGGCLWNSRDGA